IGNAAFFDWIVPEYRFDPKRIWFHGLCCYSSETLFGILSVFIGLVISPPGGFDLRAIGVANLLGFLVAFGLILEALRSLRPALSISGGLLLLVIFTDLAYVSYLNSFYTEPAALVFFLGSIGLALLVAERQDPPLWMPAAFLLSATLLATSRPQNALLGPLLALLAIRLSWGDRDASRRRHLVIGAAGVCLVSLAYLRVVSGPLGRLHPYNAVFRLLLGNRAAAVALRLRARNRPGRLRAETWIGLVVFAAFQVSISAVMDHESRRSLFLFNVRADIVFVALCLRAGTVFASRRAGWGREARTAGPDGDGAPQPLSRH